MAQCQHVEEQCRYGCGAMVTRGRWTAHATSCPSKPDTCIYCQREVLPGNMEEHYRTCDCFPVSCEGCREKIQRGKLAAHQNYSCPNIRAKCSFPDCDFEGKLGDLNEHCMTHIHLIVGLLPIANQLQEENGYLRKELNKIVDVVNDLKEQVAEVPKLKERIKSMEFHMQKVVTPLESRILDLEKDVLTLKSTDKRKTITEQDSGYRRANEGKLGDSGYGVPSYGSSNYGSGYSSGYSSGSDEDIRALIPRVNNLEQEIRFVMKKSIEEVKNTLAQTKSQLAGCVDTVQTMQESVTRHAVSMEEVKLRQDILDVKTTQGIFIWKIPEINRRFRDAQERRTLSLYSPPFHASAHGYRMCIRAYLNGDGSGKGTHISVFFVLMKSEHDNLLPWPFRRPVTFQLINQENPSSTISETFMPDVHSPSFQQPKSEMNVASGFPRFAKQSVLNDDTFTKGDSIFVRCKVDMTGLNLE